MTPQLRKSILMLFRLLHRLTRNTFTASVDGISQYLPYLIGSGEIELFASA